MKDTLKRLFHKIFPCNFNEPLCKDNFFGCRCGKTSGKAKAEEGITAAGDRAYGAGKLTPEEEAQYKGSFDTGDLLQQIEKYYMGLGPAPQGLATPEQAYLQEAGPVAKGLYEQTVGDVGKTGKELYLQGAGELGQGIYDKTLAGVGRTPVEQYLFETGDVGKALYDQISAETQDPFAYYTSTLNPQLKEAEDYINRRAQERGLLRSGIPIENMGRAGVDLAIKEAESRLAEREKALGRASGLTSQIQTTGQNAYASGQTLADRLLAERDAALSRSAGLTEYMQGMQRNRFTDLANLYGQQQQFGLNAMGRQANQAQSSAQLWAAPYTARLGDIYGQRAALYALPGQTLSAAGAALAASSCRYKKNIKLWIRH